MVGAVAIIRGNSAPLAKREWLRSWTAPETSVGSASSHWTASGGWKVVAMRSRSVGLALTRSGGT